MNSKRRALLRLSSLGVMACTSVARAQSAWPSRPVRIVVPFPPGQGTDVAMRQLAEPLGRALGQTVFVDNRPGASARLGMESLARAPSDGYTLGVGTAGTHTINPALYPKLSYDPEADFEPITLTGLLPLRIAAHPAFAATTIPQLAAAARARPNAIDVVVPALPQRIALELLRQMGGVQLHPVSYRGSSQAINDVLGGQVPLVIDSVAALRGHVAAGRLRAIAVTSARSTDAMPGVRSVAEQGITGYEITPWNALFAPKGTPTAIIDRVGAEVRRILDQPETRQRLGALGFEIATSTPAQLADRVRSERERWAQVIKANRIEAD